MKHILIFLAFIFAAFSNYLWSAQPHWAQKAGGIGFDQSFGITSDDSSNIYVTGIFFDHSTFGDLQIQSVIPNTHDFFVAKYDQDGNPAWVKHAGFSIAEGHSVTVSKNSNNVTVCGYFKDTLITETDTIISRGRNDIFISSYDNDGNFLWCRTAGGMLDDDASSITTDLSGNIYVTGNFTNSIQFNSTLYLSSGDRDIFVACYDAGGILQWVRTAGGPGIDRGNGIAEKNGKVFITGNFADSAEFGTTQLNAYGNGQSDGFISAMNSAGTFLWSKHFGGISGDAANAIAVNQSSEIFITGYFYSIDSLRFDGLSYAGIGGNDAYIAKFDSSGNAINAIVQGGMDDDEPAGVSLDVNGFVYITGRFLDSTIIGNQQFISKGAYDVFVAKFDSSLQPVSAYTYGGINYDEGHAITSNQPGNAISTGYFIFNCSFGNTSLTSVNADIFMVTLDNELQNDAGFTVTNFHTGNSNIPGNNISDVVLDKQQRPWISTQDSGIAFYNNGAWIKYTTVNSGINSDHINSIYIDSANVKWIASADSGIASYNDTVFTVYNTSNSNLPTNKINSITGFHGNPALWTGTDDFGCVRLNLITGAATVFDSSGSNVPSNEVQAMASDSAGTFWIGTAEHGAAHFVAGTITKFDTANSGIAGDHINNIFSDDSGNVWFATDQGVSKYDGANWTTFDTTTGEVANDFNDVVITRSGIQAKGSKKKGAVVNTGIVQRRANNRNLLFDNDIVSIVVDSNEIRYWIGTRSNGVFLLTDSALLLNYSSIINNIRPINIYPNPSKNLLTIEYYSEKETSETVSVSDLSGKIILSEKINSSHGINKKLIDLKNISEGYYIVTLLSAGTFSSTNLIRLN